MGLIRSVKHLRGSDVTDSSGQTVLVTQTTKRVRFSVVVPVYLNEASIGSVVAALEQLGAELGEVVEAVFVVDGSPDGSATLLRRLLADSAGIEGQLIVLSRNFGAFSAVRVGLAAAEGEYVAVMAADLQEPISLIKQFFETLVSGEFDVAVGVRTSRADPRLSRRASAAFWWLFRRYVHGELPRGGVDVFGCTRDVARELVKLDESHTSLIGLLYWVGFRRVEVAYVRQPRRHGKSSWSLRRRVRYLLDSLFSFTDLPVAAIAATGVFGIVASIAISTAVFVAWIGGAIHVPGYTPLMLVVVFMGSLILFALGIASSYVWRTYENTKRRPPAITMSHERFPLS